MNIGLRIKELANQEKLEISDLAVKLGKTKQAVYDMMSKQDLNTSVLRELAVIFKVPIIAFFQEDYMKQNTLQMELDLAKKEIERLTIENNRLKGGRRTSTKVVVELDVDDNEFVKMGLKDKVIQILNR